MGGNPYIFHILYIDFEFFFFNYLFLDFFSSSHDLLEISRLVLDQFNPFCNCYNMQM